MGERSALIAVRLAPGPRTRAPEAVVIGTLENETDWRCACWPLDRLLDRLRAGEPLLAPLDATAGAVADPSSASPGFPRPDHLAAGLGRPNGLLAGEEASALDASVGLTPTRLNESVALTVGGAAVTLKRRQTAVPLRGVGEIAFFNRRFGEVPRLDGAFAAFHTARAVDADGGLDVEAFGRRLDDGAPIGSRLVLFPDFTAVERPGALLGFTLHLQIKVAVNGHRLADVASRRQPDRCDTRAFVEAGAWRRSAISSLWHTEEGRPPEDCGARFAAVTLGCTLAPWSAGEAARASLAPIPDTDLLGLADAPERRLKVPASTLAGHVHALPAFAALGLSQRTGDAPLQPDREFGFRTLEGPLPDGRSPRRIGWRFELRAHRYGPEFAAADTARRLIPGAGLALDASVVVQVSEEQRRSDIRLVADPAAARRTVLAIRTLFPGASAPTRHAAITRAIADAASDVAAKAHAGLRLVRDGAPLSFLPRLVGTTGALPWHAVGALVDPAPSVRTRTATAETKAVAGRDPLPVAHLVSFEPCRIDDFWHGATVSPLPVAGARAVFARLTTDDAGVPAFAATLSAPQAASVDSPDVAAATAAPAYQPAVSGLDDLDAASPAVRFALSISAWQGGLRPDWTPTKAPDARASRTVQIGALALVLAPQTPAGTQFDRLGLVEIAALPPGQDAGEWRQLAAAHVRLPIAAVTPSGQDEPAAGGASGGRERRDATGTLLPDADAPLLLALSADPSGADADLVLVAEESVGRDRDHAVTLSLRSAGASQDARAARLLVLDPRPFRVAAVAHAAIAGAGRADGNEVAAWNPSGEGGLSWRVRDDAETARLTLPPQALGEAMEKFRTVPGLPADIVPGRPSAARFGTPTELSIDPTFAGTRFREPAWNLRRILGEARQRSPGARLVELRVEPFYGLLARLRADGLWITEIAGAIGDPPPPLADGGVDPPLAGHARRSRAVLSAERRRLAVDRLWRDRPDTPPLIEDGVEMRLRRRDPARPGAGPKTAFRWPVPGPVPPPDDLGGLIDADVLAATFAAGDDDATSFPGGLAWGFDSANILLAVYGRPRADAARLTGVHLSAHGMTGGARALFDSRRTLVEVDTVQGRVERYRQERVGRIAGLWNRAKHVIIYERTTVPPSPLYGPPPNKRHQDEHLGRAIPRKLVEFVEILEPLRRYPEDGEAVRASGFLVGAEFKSTRIRVQGSWGSDVRREGWQVPLWRREFGADQTDPSNPDRPSALYPKPQVRLMLAAEGGGAVPIEIDEPEKLLFYTSVVPGEDDDTDAWQPVRTVDFCDLPSPVAGVHKPTNADLTDAMLPGEPPHVPGWERLTIGLVANADKVALMHGRLDGGPAAALRNITIGRAVPPQGGSEAPAAQRLGAHAAQGAADLRAAVDARIGRVVAVLDRLDPAVLPDPATLRDLLRSEVAKAFTGAGADGIAAEIAGIAGKLAGVQSLPIADPCAAIEARLRVAIVDQRARLEVVGAGVLDACLAPVRERLAATSAVAAKEFARLQSVADEASAAAKRLAEALADAQPATPALRRVALQAAHDAHAALLGEFDTLAGDVRAEIEARFRAADQRAAALVPDLEADLADIRRRTSTDIGGVRALVVGGIDDATEDATKRVTALVASADAVLAAITAAGETIDASVMQAATGLLDLIDGDGGVRQVLGRATGAAERLNGTAAAAARRLVETLAGGVASLSTAARAIAAYTQGDVPTLKTALTNARGLLYRAGIAVGSRLAVASGTGTGEVAAVAGALTAVLDRGFDTAAEALAALRRAVAAIRTDLDAARQALLAAVDAGVAPVRAALDTLGTGIDAALAQGTAPISDALVASAHRLEETCRVLASSVQASNARVGVLRDATARAAAAFNAALDSARDGKRLVVPPKVAAAIETATANLCKALTASCEAIEKRLLPLLDSAKKLAGWLSDTLDVSALQKQLDDELSKAVGDGTATIGALRARLETKAAELARAAEGRARQALAALQEEVRDATGADLDTVARRAEGVYQKGDRAIRAFRALTDPPAVGVQALNRPEVAVFLADARKLGVDLTPSLALVNRAADRIAAVAEAGQAVGDLLDGFGVRLPTSEIVDRLVPAKLKNLSIADLIPDLAGLDFRGLLQRVGFPDLDDSEAVKLTHGFDAATRRGFLDAAIDVPLGEAAPLVSFGPVEIVLERARFTATARVTAGLGGGIEKTARGRIFGDWHVACGGTTILTFRRTALAFDETGRLDFDIDPERVELAEALAFLTDVMAASGQKGGLVVEPYSRGGVPTGVAARLDMVLPPIQTGAFGVSDLSLHILFGVSAVPRFEVACDLAIGSRMAPFTLNIWILNGGGYVLQRLVCQPAARPRPLLTYTLEVGILAGLGLGFSFGVVSGGVWLQVGCSVAIHWSTDGGGDTTAVRVFLLARGNVDVAGLITASIALMLEATYDGTRLIGAGTLSLRFKISMFYTLKVNQRVEYVFVGGPRRAPAENYSDAYA
jgi:hypothetical protein